MTPSEHAKKIREALQKKKKGVLVYPALVDLPGVSVSGAVFLSQALYWTLWADKLGGWFAKTDDEWTAKVGLSHHVLVLLRKKLKARGFLEDKVKGLPPTLHYRVAVDALAATLGLTIPDVQGEPHDNEDSNCANTATQFAPEREKNLSGTGRSYKEYENKRKSQYKNKTQTASNPEWQEDNPHELNPVEAARGVCDRLTFHGVNNLQLVSECVGSVGRNRNVAPEAAARFLVEQWHAYQAATASFKVGKRKFFEDGDYYLGTVAQWEARNGNSGKHAQRESTSRAAAARVVAQLGDKTF